MSSDLREIWREEAVSHADTGHFTETANFENSRWWTAAILKVVLSLYLSRYSADFDEIWYADANFYLENGHVMKIHFLHTITCHVPFHLSAVHRNHGTGHY